MNVAIVTMAFPQPAETFATNDVREFRRRGMTVTVHCLRPARGGENRLLAERGLSGTKVTHNGCLASLRGLVAMFARPLLTGETLRWVARHSAKRQKDLWSSMLLIPRAFDILADLERSHPEVVHLYWGHFPALVGRLVQRRRPGIATSISIIAYDLEWAYGGTPDVARAADVVRTLAAVNRPRLAEFIGIPQERIEVIFDGIDVAWLDGLRDATPKAPKSIVAIGRLVEAKGMDDVLAAFALVRARIPGSTLQILGDGPDRQRLTALAASLGVADSVVLRGHVDHAEVVRTLWRAEVMILLSRARGERLPNVVKEGMACGCVCVTTPTSGIAELVEDGATGFVVPMRDPAAAADVIAGVFTQRVDSGEMTKRAMAFVRREFDLERTIARYQESWSAALERRRRPLSTTSSPERADPPDLGRQR